MRRSKKQPEYDPNELADLIATPAVGKGVGSHLLVRNDVPSDVTTVDNFQVPPVDDSLSTSVDTTEAAPVDTNEPAPIVPGRKSFPAPIPKDTPVPALTVVTSHESTVDQIEETAVDTCPEDISKVTTVVTSPASPLPRLWISASGEIVPESRVRRVEDAHEALAAGEEALYNLLWRLPAERQTLDTRSVQAGYDSLAKGTGFSRKTIQRTVDRLIAKHYIEIEMPADIYRRTATVYRVFGPQAALGRLIRFGCTHIAKIGPGVAFVTPLSAFSSGHDTVDASDPSTVVISNLSTVDYS